MAETDPGELAHLVGGLTDPDLPECDGTWPVVSEGISDPAKLARR